MRNMATIILGCAVISNAAVQAMAGAASRPAEVPQCEIVSVKRIWDAAPHNAFTT